jgi:quercetin dioxygenase-like cupin family protein
MIRRIIIGFFLKFERMMEIDDFKQIMEGFKEKFNELKKEKQKNHEEITLLDISNIYDELKSESNLKINSIKDCCKVSECCKIPKGWGHELIIHNCKEYCGKILVFKEGCKFSMHYHILKQETWYIQKGEFKFYYIDTKKGILHKRTLTKGDVVTIERGMPHQLEAITDGKVFEISTEHFDSDSYRIAKGD